MGLNDVLDHCRNRVLVIHEALRQIIDFAIHSLDSIHDLNFVGGDRDRLGPQIDEPDAQFCQRGMQDRFGSHQTFKKAKKLTREFCQCQTWLVVEAAYWCPLESATILAGQRGQVPWGPPGVEVPG